MVQRTGSVVLLGTLNDKINIEVQGIGKGFKKIYNPPTTEENKNVDPFKHDIGQIAEGLAVAVTDKLKFKHTSVIDSSSKTPMYFVVEDVSSRTRYVVFGCTDYGGGKHSPAVAIVQDDTCSYNPKILENFINSIR